MVYRDLRVKLTNSFVIIIVSHDQRRAILANINSTVYKPKLSVTTKFRPATMSLESVLFKLPKNKLSV